MKEYEVVIGIELHAELNTQSKLFCSCKNEYGAMQNTLVCPVCMGLIGSLPRLNKKALELAVMTGLVLNSNITEHTVFERRNYFYPNLPKGYQITQRTSPICTGGGIRLDSGKLIKINRIHLEEDSGKIINGGDEYSYIDFNRSGVPLVEIVTEPMLSNTDEVVEFVTKLKDKLVFSGISDCRMEEGGLRLDVNMSIREKKFGELGTRVELKNLSSFKTLAKAIDFETRRQLKELESGNPVKKETRIWNDELSRTYAIREKEEAKDYRYFPDPDLKPVHITKEEIENIGSLIPESKGEKVNRYSALGISENAIAVLTSEKSIADYFDKVLSLTNAPTETANWIITEILRITKELNRLSISQIISEENLAQIILLVLDEKISRTNAKILLNEVVSSGKPTSAVVKELELLGGVEDNDIIDFINSELSARPEIKEEYKESVDNVTNYIIGKVMYSTNGKASPEKVKDILNQLLNK